MTSERNTHPSGAAPGDPCAVIRDRLPLFVGGDLEESARTEVTEHLAICDPCAEVAAAAVRARATFTAALSEVPVELETPDLWPGVRSQLVEEGLLDGPAHPLRLVRNPWRRVASVAAAAAAILVVVFLAQRFRGQEEHLAPSPGIGPDPFVAEIPEETTPPPAPSGLRPVNAEEEAILNTLEPTTRPVLPGRSPTGLAGNRSHPGYR